MIRKSERRLGSIQLGVLLAVSFLAVGTAGAQELPPGRAYDSIAASHDAFRSGEFQRQQAIGRQLGAIEAMRWWRCLPPLGVNGGYVRAGVLTMDRYDDSVQQPIGQRHIQTGRNRWESHPMYAPVWEIPLPKPRAIHSGPREF